MLVHNSHRIKSPGAKCSRFVARLSSGHKMCLTGTPMPHSPLDLYGQYRFLDPGIFGTRFVAFRDQYAVMGGFEHHQIIGWRNQEELRERMDTLRWYVAQEELDVPELQILDRLCELEPAARKTYKDLWKNFMAEVAGGVVTASNALAKLLRLQQISAGFAVMDDEDKTIIEISTAKRALLVDLLRDLAGEPVVVFGRFHHDLDVIHQVADELGRTCGEISGRVKQYREWRGGDYDTLAVQCQAGSLGIDLTRARVGIFFTQSLSLGDYQQAVARLHRPGQEHTVLIYRLLAHSTVDQKIVRALDKREQVINSIIGEVIDGHDGDGTRVGGAEGQEGRS